MTNFSKVSEANYQAYLSNARRTEIVHKKQEIVDTLELFHNLSPTSVLFVGFSSFIFAQYNANLYVTDISEDMQDYLRSMKIDFTYVSRSDWAQYHKKFQVVVAVDEFFTYADTDVEQRQLVEQICGLASDYVITTLRDYKNQDYRDREFSLPVQIRDSADHRIFLEAHDWNSTDRNCWSSNIYEINTHSKGLAVYGPSQRHTMFFKQLAKFSMDAGASGFLVHKNLMYKGLIKKNYEHVITIKFE